MYESVRELGILLGPVRSFEIFLGPGPVRSQASKFFSVLVRADPGSLNFFRSSYGPVLGTGPGPIGYGPWIHDYFISQ